MGSVGGGGGGGLIGPQDVRGCRSGVGSGGVGVVVAGASLPHPRELGRCRCPELSFLLSGRSCLTGSGRLGHFAGNRAGISLPLSLCPELCQRPSGPAPLPHQAPRAGPGSLALLDFRVGPGHSQCGRWLAAAALSSCKVARGTVVSRPIVCHSCWPLEAWTGPTAPPPPVFVSSKVGIPGLLGPHLRGGRCRRSAVRASLGGARL